LGDPTDFSGMTDEKMMGLYGAVMAELLERNIVHSGNNPIADIAEHLVADQFGVEPEHPNQMAYDFVTKDGLKVPGQGDTTDEGLHKGLSAIHSLAFDVLAIVIFKLDLKIEKIALVPVEVVKDHAGWSKTWGAHSLW
jgi:hypothetical protein